MSLEADMLRNIHAGLAHHDATCPMPARAILLNPGNFELFGWDEILGVPVEPHDGVPPERFRIDCSGSAFGIEDQVEQLIAEPVFTPDAPTVPAAPIPGPFVPDPHS